MIYFKRTDESIWAYDIDGSQDDLIQIERDSGSQEIDQPAQPVINPRILEIDSQLMSNDLKMIRPSAAIAAAMIGSQEIMDADMQALQVLMSANEALRSERRTLTGG